MRIGEGWTQAQAAARVEIEGRWVSREWWFRKEGDRVAIVFLRPDDGRPRYCAAIDGRALRTGKGHRRSWSSPGAAAKAIEDAWEVERAAGALRSQNR